MSCFPRSSDGPRMHHAGQKWQHFFLRWIHLACRAYIRLAPWGVGRYLVWRRVCRPYLNWRDITIVAPAKFGALISCNLPDMIQAHLFYFGQWEPNLSGFLRRYLRPGDTFIDVGANIGYFSLLASSLVGPDGQIVAIEASPDIFRQLEGNIIRNGIKNIRAINVAASDHYGEVDLYRGVAGNLGSTTLSKSLGTSIEGTVPAFPFNEILTPTELSAARVIKIDIEGAELPVLNQIVTRIQEFHPNVQIVVEVALPEDDERLRQVNELLRDFEAAGFFCYRLTNEFCISRYLGDKSAQPAFRFAGKISETMDLVFSRAEADFV